MSKKANINKLVAEFEKMNVAGRWPAKEASDHALRAHREFAELTNVRMQPYPEDIRAEKLNRMYLNVIQARAALDILMEQLQHAIGS